LKATFHDWKKFRKLETNSTYWLISRIYVHTTKKTKFIVESEEVEENDKSDGEGELKQNIGYDTVCAKYWICIHHTSL
jgi:hypothetical protein